MPIILNTISGIENVSPLYSEVGQGLGMNRFQILLNIKFPLAFPVILSGIRTSIIMSIGGATLASSTGAGGLGRIISQGGSTTNMIFLIEGTFPIVILSLIIERILVKFENLFHHGKSF